jgi:hypothetical protein
LSVEPSETPAMALPRVRFTVRRMMLAVAVIGLAVFAVRQMVFANTVYSAGYDEIRFRQVRVGMTSSEVEALLGPPLRKVPWWPDQALVCWKYTNSRPWTSKHYWRRDVFVKDEKVCDIITRYEWTD